MSYKKLWIALVVVMVASFSVLGGVGVKLIRSAPPIPAQVVADGGRVLFSGETIRNGQNVWQSIGGQELGSVWGHGAYVAPDWTADWLHRECVFILDRWAKETGAASYSALPAESQAALRERLQQLMRRNTYDAQSDRITVDPAQAAAIEELSARADEHFDYEEMNVVPLIAQHITQGEWQEFIDRGARSSGRSRLRGPASGCRLGRRGGPGETAGSAQGALAPHGRRA